MKKIFLAFLLYSILWISCQPNSSSFLVIATSANMQFAIEEIVEEFKAETGLAVETIISSSGKLSAQIQEGAPFDILISADMKYPMDLYEKGYTTAEPKVYAFGKLVLWTNNTSINPSLEILEEDNIKHIALANPKTAPYGVAAMQVLQKNNMEERLAPKLVFGESISQVNQFVNTQAAEIGFTAKAVVLSAKVKDNSQWFEIDKADYTPIKQGVVVLNRTGQRRKDALKFKDFLLSEKASDILNKFGYDTESIK